MELRRATQQVVRVGVLLTKQTKLTDPLNPVYGAKLSWYYWRYLIKADGSVVDIVNHTWCDVPNCAGVYFLTLTVLDTNVLGSLMIYIYDAFSLGQPILTRFSVIDENVYDSKYGKQLLKVEPEAQKF